MPWAPDGGHTSFTRPCAAAYPLQERFRDEQLERYPAYRTHGEVERHLTLAEFNHLVAEIKAYAPIYEKMLADRQAAEEQAAHAKADKGKSDKRSKGDAA